MLEVELEQSLATVQLPLTTVPGLATQFGFQVGAGVSVGVMLLPPPPPPPPIGGGVGVAFPPASCVGVGAPSLTQT